MTGAASLVQVRDLVKTYDEGEAAARILRGVNLDIARSELVALLGPSGSGKSTLLNILGTLMRPTGGTLTILGESLIGAADDVLTEFRNRHIGFVFQAHLLLPDFTALENVVFPAAARHGRERRGDLDRAADLLDRVGLSDRRDYLASKLSGGQKQRVAVARSLMNAPELVLADEPTGNLDRESADQVMTLLTEMNEEGTAFLISTHDEKIASRCRRQVFMVDGQVAADRR
ncbi:MAG: ABC transporter ATP-binding protein [Devosia sp.]